MPARRCQMHLKLRNERLPGLQTMQRLPGLSRCKHLPMRKSTALNKASSAHLHNSSSWTGSGSQHDLMATDQCITVNEEDEVLGHASKYDVHRFNESQPKGVLHRAFSVFLFNEDNKLLLQQRAAGKITFPNVWTNTCCSHPLFGQLNDEVDDANAAAMGLAQGAKVAAVRKLHHELGIPPEQLPPDSFKFLTRLHYCAADKDVTTGQPTGWGEHEMDYILFARANVDMQANPEEVQDTAYVTEAELREMMVPSNGLLWSPWFRIIVTEFLTSWWKDLDRTLTTDSEVDWKNVHHILE